MTPITYKFIEDKGFQECPPVGLGENPSVNEVVKIWEKEHNNKIFRLEYISYNSSNSDTADFIKCLAIYIGYLNGPLEFQKNINYIEEFDYF